MSTLRELDYELALWKYPQLHTDLPPERIHSIIAKTFNILVLTKDGELYHAVCSAVAKYQESQPRFQVFKMAT